MIFKKIGFVFSLFFAVLSHGTAWAGTHVWIPTTRTIESGFTLPPVVIRGERINWGVGFFDNDFNANDTGNYSGGAGMGNAIASAKERALDLANACKNPFISQDSKDTTANSSVESRWFAAQDMFNSIQAKNLWGMYGSATAITIIVDSKNYAGFTVTYSDGSKETWVVNPGHRTSSVKLFDQPAPGSMKPGSPGSGCKANG